MKSHANKTYLHNKAFALSLVLKVRVFGTGKNSLLTRPRNSCPTLLCKHLEIYGLQSFSSAAWRCLVNNVVQSIIQWLLVIIIIKPGRYVDVLGISNNRHMNFVFWNRKPLYQSLGKIFSKFEVFFTNAGRRIQDNCQVDLFPTYFLFSCWNEKNYIKRPALS